ncbi:hypothetical protein DXT99_02525 [Pontibacter diazotrophicus]|uniref:Uncharacterized protein n=1 Tax=Pontibacter diazotrophicus TaxID=1400979 RepID=A0A3D8LH23_9BACT|nr:hypothetical protein [Pontibacter diazotrophicus]RDV16677.1 hypothetical protein DXT99_02525 [Pontibacter diazotrophicus]
MKKSSVRWLFVLVVLLLFTELLLALKLTEPFPAIIYPSFADIPSFNSPIQKPRIVAFFHNQDSIEIDKEDFFYNMSNVYNNVVLLENFNTENSFQVSSKDVRELQATIGTRSMSFDLNETRNAAQIEEGKIWIANTLKNILKRDDIIRVEVQWYSYNISPNEDEALEQGELVEKYVVSFIN